MYLLDTNVVSELRKSRTGRCNPSVQRWIDRVPDSALYISAITVLELETGVLLVRQRDIAQATVLHNWLHEQVLSSFAGRILPVDLEIALRCAALHVPSTRSHYDALIAATALVRSFMVVTRNTADFAPTGVATLNPWQA